MVSCFPDLSLFLGSRLVYNHFPLLLESVNSRMGPIPFRFENMWLEYPNFQTQARNWLNELEEEGWEGFKIIVRLNLLKCELKVWNKEELGEPRKRKIYKKNR